MLSSWLGDGLAGQDNSAAKRDFCSNVDRQHLQSRNHARLWENGGGFLLSRMAIAIRHCFKFLTGTSCWRQNPQKGKGQTAADSQQSSVKWSHLWPWVEAVEAVEAVEVLLHYEVSPGPAPHLIPPRPVVHCKSPGSSAFSVQRIASHYGA